MARVHGLAENGEVKIEVRTAPMSLAPRFDSKATIRVQLAGGLGNQLFQYAFGRAVSLRSGCSLELDAYSGFVIDRRYRRSFALGPFQLPKEVRVLEKLGKLEQLATKAHRRLSKGVALKDKRYVEETKRGTFQPEFADWQARRSAYVAGYWHCPRYFEEFADEVCRELTFRSEHLSRIEKWACQFVDTTAVAVHVRRRDFWSKLDFAYYKLAMERFRQGYERLHFLVFTDDPDWWRSNCPDTDDVTLVSDESLSDIDCFHLMTLCRL